MACKSRFTVGLIGAGSMAQVHARGWQQVGAEVVVFAPTRGEDLAGRVGCRWASSMAELLQHSDAIDVCTPTDSHPELVLAAADAGLDVLCEKPLATNSHVVQQMINACAVSDVKFVPAMVGRYFDAYAMMHRQVEQELLGDVVVQRFDRMGASPEAAWYHRQEVSGGLIFDQMIHDLDLARWIGGDVQTVFARESVPVVPRHLAVADTVASTIRTAAVTLTHDSGAISTLTGTWGSRETRFRTRCEITGTQGVLRHDSSAHPALHLQTDKGQLVPEENSAQAAQLLPDVGLINDPYLTQVQETYAYFRGGAPPRAVAADALAAVRAAEAALESLASGRAVSLVNEPVADDAEVADARVSGGVR